MSIIGNLKLVKENEQIKKDETIKENPITCIREKSIADAKELIKKLLHNVLDNPLLKLESNSSNHMTSLKTSSKSFNEYSKLINNLVKNVEENKKKKIKDKKPQPFRRRSKKTLTQQHLKSRSRTIECNLIKFRSKAVLGIVDNNKKNINKNNNLKIVKKVNANMINNANKTMNNFRKNENESIEETASQKYMKFQNYAYHTTQNFRKNTFKTGPGTPRKKMREKIKDKNLDKTFNQYDKGKNSVTDLFNTKINNTKKIEKVYDKNLHSQTLILNPLTDIDERIENNTWNKPKKNVKNIKGILYKNDKKILMAKLNSQLDKIDEKKNTLNDKKILVKKKEKEKKELQVENIVKLVDDVNQNLNKLLSENQNKRKNTINEGNNKNNRIISKHRNSITLVNAINDVRIKELTDNKNEINKNMEEKNIDIENDNKNVSKEGIKDNKKEIASYKSEIKENSYIKIFDINKKEEKELNNSFINHIINNRNKEKEEINILKLRKNKSTSNIKLTYNNIRINNNEECHRSYKEVVKIINLNENKKEEIIKEVNNNNEKKVESLYSYIKISNQLKKQIINKMKQNIDKINKENKNNELLNQSTEITINNEQMDKKEKFDNKYIDINKEKFINLKVKKVNSENVHKKINCGLNKSFKILIKNNIICENIIKRVKSDGKIKKNNLLI